MGQYFIEAVKLLLTFDQEIYNIFMLSLYVSLTSTFISAVIGIPAGTVMGIKNFIFKKFLVRFIYTAMSLPPVIVGLLVFLLLSRRGPLAFLEINLTPAAMIIAQTCLITPIITGIVYNGAKEKGEEIRRLAKTLGASRYQTLILLIKELRISTFIAVVSGCGRALSEVGAVMIVGGNIRGHTRVMTTTIAMLNSMGDYSRAISIGIMLLGLSFFINTVLYHFQQQGD